MPSSKNSHCQPCEAVPAVELEDEARERAADDRRQRNREHEPRDRARAVLRRVPVAEVIDDAGQEAGLRDAEQEPQHVEAVGPDTNIIATDKMPHVIMMRAIHSRAPTRTRIRLLGTSNSA